MAMNMKMAASWNVVACSLVDTDIPCVSEDSILHNEELHNLYSSLGRDHMGDSHTLEDNIKMYWYLQEIRCEDIDWIPLA
jgi:hypothetical protein